MSDVVQLTRELVAIPSASQISNRAVSDHLTAVLMQAGFTVEALSYTDGNGYEKVSLVAQKGVGSGGLGFFSHSDTVPGAEDQWNPYDGEIKDGKLFGRGSCDMKGPLAATIVAAAQIDTAVLRKPITIVVTADEEKGFGGAKYVAEASQTFAKNGWPEMGVIAEPTELKVVYAHKGGYFVKATAHGRAAHSSTDQGISANFLIAPFLAEMAELAQIFKRDEQYMNHEFTPPTNGFNMVIDDGNCAPNVTAAKTVCSVNLRSMPHAHYEEAIGLIVEKAKKYRLEVETHGYDPFYTNPEHPIVQLSLKATGEARAGTVPYGTDALIFKDFLPLVMLGPGHIAQAHTVGEWIDIAQLECAVDVYRQMIVEFCL